MYCALAQVKEKRIKQLENRTALLEHMRDSQRFPKRRFIPVLEARGCNEDIELAPHSDLPPRSYRSVRPQARSEEASVGAAPKVEPRRPAARVATGVAAGVLLSLPIGLEGDISPEVPSRTSEFTRSTERRQDEVFGRFGDRFY